MAEEILLENDRVKVTRVTLGPGEAVAPSERCDRVVSYLDDGEIEHHNHTTGHRNVHARKVGDSLWRDASRHVVTNTGDRDLRVLITEIK